MRHILAISAGILLAACDAGIVTRELSVPLPDRYSAIAPVTQPTRENLEWWRNFNDPVLDQLIAIGLSGNLSIAEAQARLRELEANARGARNLWSGSGAIGAARRSGGVDTADIDLGATINLAGAQQRRAEAALARLDAARFGSENVRRLLLQELSVAYVNLRFFQERLSNRRQDQASRQQTVEAVGFQLQAGDATLLDQLRIRSLEAETRVEIPAIESEIIRQRNQISTLLGVPAGALTIDLSYKGRQPQPVRIADLGVPADLLRARPDIRRAEQVYAAALSDVSAAKADRYPRLSLDGAITSSLGGGASAINSLAAGLILPVFNQPALAADVDASEARVNQAYLQWRQAVLEAVEEVETAQATLRSTLSAQAAAREVVQMNTQALDVSRELLAIQSEITVLDFIDTERTLSLSRATLALTTRDVATSYIELRSALGQGHTLETEQPQIASGPRQE